MTVYKTTADRSHFMTTPLPENQEALIAMVGDASLASDQRTQAISKLGDMLVEDGSGLQSARGMMALIDLIKTETNPRLVGHGIGVLGRVQAVSAVMSIVDVCLGTGEVAIYKTCDIPEVFLHSDEGLRLRCIAVQALGRMQDDRALVPLMSLLNNKDENYRLRLTAAESLGKLGHQQAVSSLVDILADDREKSIYLKESAAKALGMLQDIRALMPLIDILESKQGIRGKFNFLKEQIIEAIGRIGQRGEARKVTDSLVKALKDEASSIRLAAIEALGEIGDTDCLEPLKEMLLDKEDDIAYAAISAIYRVGGEIAIRDIMAMENLPKFLRDELESYIP